LKGVFLTRECWNIESATEELLDFAGCIRNKGENVEGFFLGYTRKARVTWTYSLR